MSKHSMFRAFEQVGCFASLTLADATLEACQFLAIQPPIVLTAIKLCAFKAWMEGWDAEDFRNQLEDVIIRLNDLHVGLAPQHATTPTRPDADNAP